MSEASSAGPRESSRPLRALRGEEADAYIDRVSRVVRGGRLNAHYPDARAVAAHLEAMHSSVMRGLYDGVEVELETGLPTYQAWARVQTDASVSAEVLRDIGGDLAGLRARAAAGEPGNIFSKQLLKHAYHSWLEAHPVMALDAMQVSLRRVEPEEKRAFFHIVFDKLDTRGHFVRYSIDLSQRSSFWTRAMIQLSDDDASHTASLRSRVYRFASFDAEFTFVNLAAEEGITVERVFKATIGPVFVGGLGQEAPLAGLIPSPEGVIGCFGLDMASIDVSDDRDNDPMEDLMLGSLSGAAREDYEEARRRYGYKVFKDRKFVADPATVPYVRAWCSEAGTKNIIYTLRGGRRRRRRRRSAP